MKALVTGATGFIGSHLAEALIKQGFDVCCLVRNTSNLCNIEGLHLSIKEGDCADRESLSEVVKDVDYVFHLAGLTKARSDVEFFVANVKGTENIINAVLKNNPYIKRFIYLSSLAASGPSRDGNPLKEYCEPNPVSVYGRTKLEGEKIVFAYKDKIPVTIIRPPAVYGPRDKDMLIFFKMVSLGIIPYWGESYYSFIYIDDLINVIILSALKKEAEGEVFFVSDGNIYSIDDIITAISNALQKRPTKIVLPKFLMPIIGFVSEKVKGVSIINTDKIKEMRHTHWICDTTKAMEMLKFTPRVHFQEGVKWTADWYRIHRWL